MNAFEFERTVLNRIENDNMLNGVDNIVIGFSGGSDSVALLHVLNKYKHKLKVNLCAVHINHNIRGEEAQRDEAFAKDFCKKKGIDIKVFSLDVSGYAKENKFSTEEAGRILRYEHFEKMAKSLEKKGEKTVIAVAHNSDDNVETVLFNVFRGCGIKGLGGILPSRDNIIRPLIDISKCDIEKYLEEEGEKFVVDSTNLQNDYTRNVLRNEILPLVTNSINNNAYGAINRLSIMARDTADFIEEYAGNLYEQYVSKSVEKIEKKEKIEISKDICKLHKVIRLEIYRKCFKETAGCLKDVTGEHMEMLDNLIFKQVGSRCDLPYEVSAFREYAGIVLCKNTRKNDEKYSDKYNDKYKIDNNSRNKEEKLNKSLIDADFSFEVIENEDKIRKIIKNGVFAVEKKSEKKYTKYLDYDKIKGEFFLRKRKTGDFIVINEKGNTKKIKDIFTDMKIPREERDKTLLLCDEKCVLWIVGIRGSFHVNVDSSTKRILKVDVILG